MMLIRGRLRAAVPLWALCALLPCAAQGQSAREVRSQNQFWGSLNSTTRLTDRLGVIADFHVRRNDVFAEPSFYFVRLGANAWLSERLTLSLGYAHLWKAPGCDDCQTWAGENRIYQQVQYATAIGRTRVVHRLRNEQRWQETVRNDVRTGERSLSNRVRYLVSFTIPVSARPEIPSLVLSDEVALQFGRDIVANTFDQNRLFAGIKQRLGREWSFDLGYMLVYQQKASGYQYDLNHTLRWFVYFTPDLRRGRHQRPGVSLALPTTRLDWRTAPVLSTLRWRSRWGRQRGADHGATIRATRNEDDRALSGRG